MQLQGRPTQYLTVRNGLNGTRDTLKIMSRAVRAGKKHPIIRELALQIIRGIPGKDYPGEIRAVHKWVQSNIRYTQDVRGIETIQYPWVTLDIGQGDCDYQAVLVASLLEAIGKSTRFSAIGFAPGQCAHVLAEVRLGKGWVTVETTEPVPVGWIPQNVKTRIVYYN